MNAQLDAQRWKRRVSRAGELAEVFPAAGELLKFYSRIATFQESIFESLRRTACTDLSTVARRMPDLCALVETLGPATLAGCAREMLDRGMNEWEAILRSRWDHCRSESVADHAEEFFGRALLQPYAEYLASRGHPPGEGEGVCPFCTARPVAGVLRPEGDGAKRSLICSLCATEWVYRRLVCPNCGETDKGKLSAYKAEGIEHVRVEACDSCRFYLKSVDLSVNGLALPVVDELATVVLDLWAAEAGYAKIQANLLGF
jgi:FdhE protein